MFVQCRCIEANAVSGNSVRLPIDRLSVWVLRTSLFAVLVLSARSFYSTPLGATSPPSLPKGTSGIIVSQLVGFSAFDTGSRGASGESGSTSEYFNSFLLNFLPYVAVLRPTTGLSSA